MIHTITYKEKQYPSFQAEGNAAQFAIPFARHVCKGRGVDVGCNRLEWAYPDSILIDPAIDPQYDALNFPPNAHDLDYIFSSHCLEHLSDWVTVLDYWTSKLKQGGTLFLYLPDYSQEYWRPWNNRKHLNILSPSILKDYLHDRGYSNIFTSQVDLNNAFTVMADR
jgi:predicted SAM-dependent methyltransferase